MPIRKLKARMIYSTQGEPALEVDLLTGLGLFRSSAALLLGSLDPEDADAAALVAITKINETLAPRLVAADLEEEQLAEVDRMLDDIGPGAIAVSIAACKAAGARRGLPLYKYVASLMDDSQNLMLPAPLIAVFRGVMLLPVGAQSFAEAMQMGLAVYRELERRLAELAERPIPVPAFETGSFASSEISDDRSALELISQIIAELDFASQVRMVLDPKILSRFHDGKYELGETDAEGGSLDAAGLLEYYQGLASSFPELAAIQDPFHPLDPGANWSGLQEPEDDTPGLVTLASFTAELDKPLGDVLVIELSSLASISEALEIIGKARANRQNIVISTLSGDTDDVFMADLAVGVGANAVSIGAPCRSGRIGKVNQFLRIEAELGLNPPFASDKLIIRD